MCDASLSYSALVTMPFERSSSFDLKGRAWTILSAVVWVIPGGVMSCSWVAAFRSIFIVDLDDLLVVLFECDAGVGFGAVMALAAAGESGSAWAMGARPMPSASTDATRTDRVADMVFLLRGRDVAWRLTPDDAHARMSMDSAWSGRAAGVRECVGRWGGRRRECAACGRRAKRGSEAGARRTRTGSRAEGRVHREP